MDKTEIFDYMAANGHEKVLCFQNEDVGLRAVLAIHSTVLGPAAGGCRMWTYTDDLAAMEDALRLSKGMTYKYAAAGINLGGGKIVVIGDPKRRQGREMLFRALGRFIDSLGGEYLTGEDVGTTLARHGLHARRDPERDHAARVRRRRRTDRPGDRVRRAAGDASMRRAAVGLAVAARQAGARAGPRSGWGADGGLPRRRGCHGARQRHRPGQGLGNGRTHTGWLRSRQPTSPPPTSTCTARAPWGRRSTTSRSRLLQASIVCGSANNQLAEPRHGDELHRRGVLYAPDYIANAGGTVFDTDRLWGGVNKDRGMAKVAQIYERMHEVFAISKAEDIATYAAADRLAESQDQRLPRPSSGSTVSIRASGSRSDRRPCSGDPGSGPTSHSVHSSAMGSKLPNWQYFPVPIAARP